ncbi:MAG: tRNA (adenosine(37)-N6)-threonylcarbamoyltransferase complex ATPase subunit type 1 TsaE [Gulosibacter sp.]|uniref:tRNA (adenosine(37)-N6)-threonylcarbamoyltransferase complex ATPase subunit type 1 TsaE n=1 Tax=Gulosibacter sp. TaxID=2817531 RepID=UPI003F8F36FF
MEGFGARLAAELRAGDVLVLTGPLGAGKTTLVRGLGEALGVRGTVASPTFVIARTHPALADGPALIHVDAYRLNSALELDDLDLDFDASVTVIEWGSEYVSAIAESWLEIVIERARAGDVDTENDEDARQVSLRAVGERWASVPLATILAG